MRSRHPAAGLLSVIFRITFIRSSTRAAVCGSQGRKISVRLYAGRFDHRFPGSRSPSSASTRLTRKRYDGCHARVSNAQRSPECRHWENIGSPWSAKSSVTFPLAECSSDSIASRNASGAASARSGNCCRNAAHRCHPGFPPKLAARCIRHYRDQSRTRMDRRLVEPRFRQYRCEGSRNSCETWPLPFEKGVSVKRRPIRLQ